MSSDPSVTPFTAQPACTDFTNISLEGTEKPRKKKEPRRLIHFSDGVLEEYSTDEEEEDAPPPGPLIDPRTLTWGPWMWYYMSVAGWKSLSVADVCGEKLAWFFGITTPKYQSAIDEFYRLKHEEEKEKECEEKLRQQLEGLSSVDVSFVDKPKDKGSGDENLEKF